MSNEKSLRVANQKPCYRNVALKLMNIYESKEKKPFHLWLNRFEYVADFIDVPKDKMGEFFCEMLGQNKRKIVKKIRPNFKVSEVPYEEMINCYIQNILNADDKIIHRNRFYHRMQYKKERIENYARHLRKISDMSNINENDVEQKLKEQFVKGICENRIKNELLKIDTKSFDELVESAIELENSFLITHYVDSALSKINIYNSKKEGLFYVWLNKFEYVADLINVPDNLMVEFFNKMVYNDVHTSVQKRNSSVNISKLPYDQIINNYLKHFATNDEFYLHRKRFMFRKQYEIESIKQYANNLYRIYDKCHYRDFEGKKLCAQFVHGIFDKDIRTYLMNITDLTFTELVAEATKYKLNKNNSSNELSDPEQ